MTKVKELTSIVVLLFAGAAMALMLFTASKPKVQAGALPTFAYDEITVTQKSLSTAKVAKSVAPVLPPKAVAPLPIFPPKVAFQVTPNYPAAVLEKGQEGIVLLSVLVGSFGFPERIEQKASSGIAELDRAALAAISQWKFEPARQGAQAISSWFEIPVSFKIEP